MDKKGEIISILLRDYGESISINELTRRLNRRYGSAHYPNVHEKVEEMKADGTISLERVGRSLLVRLDQSNPMLADTLAEHDLAEKRRFLADNPDFSADWLLGRVQPSGTVGATSCLQFMSEFNVDGRSIRVPLLMSA